MKQESQQEPISCLASNNQYQGNLSFNKLLGTIITRTMFKYMPIVMASLLTQGCVGVMTRYTGHHIHQAPSIHDKPGVDGVYTSASRTPQKVTADRLREHWGEPASIMRDPADPQSEIWTYKFDRVWCGVIPCIVVPIPLLLPVERERVSFFIRDGEAIKADVVELKMGGAGQAFVSPDGPRSW